MLITDLGLTVTPTTALYNASVPDSAITVNEDKTQGRNAVILDFNNTKGLYSRDLGTIFSWPTNNGLILDIWQPTIIPKDSERYNRLSFHCLMTSLNGVGWQHAREMNLAYNSSQPLTLLLTFDQWPAITLTVPSSGGADIKNKVTLPVNKFKMMEIFVSSTVAFRMFVADLELKIRSWGSSGAYRLERPVSG
jgi:hypothetical protein